MRILVAHQVPRQRTGGMSRIMGFIHDRVAAAGHTADYFCADDVPARRGGWVRRHLTFPLLIRRHAIEAARSGKPYDIVNVHEPCALAIAAWKRSAGNPMVVVTSHGLERRAWDLAKEELRLGREGPPLKTRLTYPVSGLWPAEAALKRADHIFCLNSEDRDYLVTRFGRRAETVTRIYPAADQMYACAASSRDYRSVERVLFAGTWRKNKGIEDLVPAFTALARLYSDLRLVVLGAGVPNHIVQHSFPDWVRPRVECQAPEDEFGMAAAFAAADVFLLPSLFEGTPLTLMQAMMSGLPIVTTATCGMKDVIRHRDNGILVPTRAPEAIASAVGSLIADPAWRERLGRAAQADAGARYTWDRVARPVTDVYEALVGRRSQWREDL